MQVLQVAMLRRWPLVPLQSRGLLSLLKVHAHRLSGKLSLISKVTHHDTMILLKFKDGTRRGCRHKQ